MYKRALTGCSTEPVNRNRGALVLTRHRPVATFRKLSMTSQFGCFALRRTVCQNSRELDGSLPANPLNDRRVANAVTLKSTFRLP